MVAVSGGRNWNPARSPTAEPGEGSPSSRYYATRDGSIPISGTKGTHPFIFVKGRVPSGNYLILPISASKASGESGLPSNSSMSSFAVFSEP